MHKIISVLTTTLLAACATAPVEPLSNTNEIQLSELGISDLSFSTGLVDGSVYTGAYRKIEKWHYGATQQQQFMDVLGGELEKVGADLMCTGGDCKRIHVFFARTYYESNATQYFLNVNMTVTDDSGERAFSYAIDSSEVCGYWSASPPRCRQIASQLLLDGILGDLQ